MKTYQKQLGVTCPPELFPVLQPRGYRQVVNSQTTARKKEGLSHDEYYNLLLMAHELPDFIKDIVLFPYLLSYVMNSEILQEFNKLLLIQNVNGMYITYDTTFCLGDFFVSVLVFRHIIFKTDPAIPLGFMIHHRKFQEPHERFLRIISKECVVTRCH